jgi:hypothetical protein
MDEAAMLVARADDGGETREQVGASMARFLDTMRPRESLRPREPGRP